MELIRGSGASPQPSQGAGGVQRVTVIRQLFCTAYPLSYSRVRGVTNSNSKRQPFTGFGIGYSTYFILFLFLFFRSGLCLWLASVKTVKKKEVLARGQNTIRHHAVL